MFVLVSVSVYFSCGHEIPQFWPFCYQIWYIFNLSPALAYRVESIKKTYFYIYNEYNKEKRQEQDTRNDALPRVDVV